MNRKMDLKFIFLVGKICEKVNVTLREKLFKLKILPGGAARVNIDRLGGLHVIDWLSLTRTHYKIL